MVAYLASSWSRRSEMRQIRSELNSVGVCVNARWLDEEETPPRDNDKYMRENAFADIKDVVGCDVFVRFSDDLSSDVVPSNLATGARFFEMGLAYKEGIPIVVVGGKQCIFDFLPVTHLKDKEELKSYLSPV